MDSEEPTKTCFTCKTCKPISEFGSDKNKKRKDGKSPYCRKCASEKQRSRWAKTQKDPEKWEKEKKSRADYYRKNKERMNLVSKEWAKNNKDRINDYMRAKYEDKMSSSHGNIEFKVLQKIRKLVRRIGPRSKRTEWDKVLGYTFDELKTHLESLFTDGMNWELLKNGAIEIDHIIPKSAFYYETIEDKEFKECWALKNLQPMWKSENRAKADKMPDGSDGRLIGYRKKMLLDEDFHMAGWESAGLNFAEEDLSG